MKQGKREKMEKKENKIIKNKNMKKG